MPSNVKLLAGASGGEPTDANFKNVTLLLHGDGSNGAQNNTFIDSSTNNFTITRNGNTTQGSFSPYGSNWSNYFDGSGDYLTATSNAAFQFGTGDFTIEAWIYVTNYASTCAIFDTRTSGNEASGVIFYVRSDGKIELYRSAAVVTASTALSQNSWNHVAVTRSGSTCTLWLNGVSVGTATDSTNLTQQNSFIGAAYTGSANMMVGYISNLRVVKGTAVYTSAFTPSTTPLTAITNTSLLTCAYNRFRDGSTNNFTITRNGDVKVTNFAPFAPSSAYSTTTNGGSAYFDGSGDYLSAPNNAALNMSGSTFTLECWIYPNGDFSDYRTIMSKRNASTTSYQMFLFQTTGYLSFSRANTAYQSSATPTINSWNHVAAVYDGTNINLYLNGTRVLQTAVSIADTTDPLLIGAIYTGGENFNGYISNARVLKGTQAYTGTTYTVPTAPVTAITNTSLLLNATNAAIFDNSMKNDLETVGNAQISTSVKKFGTGSMYFDGSGDYLRAANNDIFAFGTGDFTVEMWAYFADNTATNRPLLDTGVNSNTGRLLIRQGNDAGTSNVVNAFVSGTTVGSPTISFNQWTHVAVVRQSGTVKIYINGTGGTGVSAAADLTQNGCLIGAFYDQLAWNFTGYIDDLRITKGVARYTANFTAPTAPFPNK